MNAASFPTPGRLIFDQLLLQPNLRLRIGAHVVDVGALRIVTQPQQPRLTSKAIGVLLELVRCAGDTVTRDRLLERVWADRVTTPDVLTQAIKELRRGFGDDTRPSRYIETIPKVGYRLLAPVSVVEAEASASETPQPVAAGNDPDITPPAAHVAAAGRRQRRWFAAGAALALAAIAVFAGVLRSRLPSAAAADAWTASDVHAVTYDPGSERRPAMSPDGTRVVFAQLDAATGVDRLVVRALGQSQSVRLTAKSDAFEEMPIWSPDGAQIAFERLANDRCTVYIVPSIGGPEREVGACEHYLTHYFDWTPDGKALITAENTGGSAASMALVRWDLATGVRQPLRYERTAGDQDLEAHYSPDGRYIAFRRGLAPYSDLCVMSADGGAVRQLTQLHARIRGFAWTAASDGLVFASNHDGRFTLYTIDLHDAAVRALGVGPAEYPSAARHGENVAYEIPRTKNRLAWVRLGANDAVPELLAPSTGSDGAPALSPDGGRIAFVSDRSGTQQLWLYDFASAGVMALTEFGDALLAHPTFSTDGTRLLVTARGKDAPGLVEIDLATRRQRVIAPRSEDVLSGHYGVDPDSYLLVLGAANGQTRLVLLEDPAGARRQTLLATGIEHAEADPVTRSVYYTKNAEGGLFRRPLNGGSETPVTTRIDASRSDGWRVVDGRIWYVAKVAWKPTDLLELDPATGSERSLGRLDTELHDVSFSPSPARDRIVIAPLGVEDTDVGAFRLRANGQLVGWR